MRTRVLAFGLPLATLLVFAAASCGDDETTSTPSVPDSGVPDTATGGDTGPRIIDDGGLTADAQPDAPAADAGPTIALYSIIDGKLVTLDPVTGAVAEIGPTGQTFAPLVWDVKANVARIIKTALTAPTLGTVNLCTGAITDGPRMTVVGAGDLDMAEGFTQDPVTGTFYATVDLDNSATTVTEATATVNVTTGACTTLGTHTTTENDGDVLAWIGGALRLLDVSTQNSKSTYYTIDTGTGAATVVKEQTGSVLMYRFAEDTSRGKVFATYGSVNFATRGLATLDFDGGALSNIGAGLDAGAYPGSQFQALMVAPKPACP